MRFITTIIWLFLVALFTGSAQADSCQIQMTDLTVALESLHKGTVVRLTSAEDPDSGEPVARYAQVFDDGTIVFIEQKHCMMYNLTVTVIIPAERPLSTAADRIAVPLEQTVTWKKWLAPLNAREILDRELHTKRFAYSKAATAGTTISLDHAIHSTSEHTEALLTVIDMSSAPLPYRAIVSLYLGVGGE